MGFFCGGLLDRQVSVSVDGYSESQILVIVSFNSYGGVTFGKAIFREVQITLAPEEDSVPILKVLVESL